MNREPTRDRRPRGAAAGMLAGTVLAAGLLVPLFSFTGEAMYLVFIGAGTGIGLALGAAWERRKRR